MDKYLKNYGDNSAVEDVTKLHLSYFNVYVFEFDPKMVDFNKIGILYELLGHYYTVYETVHSQSGQRTLRRAWIAQRLVGAYLKHEWLALPKDKVGKHGQGAPSSDGWWSAHSAVIQRLRLACLIKAKEVEANVWKQQEMTGQEMDTRQYVNVLEAQFMRVVDALYGTMKVQEMEQAKVAEQFMEEFMVFDEQTVATSESG